MNTLEEIGIRIVEEERGDSSGNARALLHEIATMLQQLLENGETGVIDLRSMPLSAEEYHTLHEILGEGEVTATLETLGSSRVRETSIAGVWWIIHHNAEDEVIAEMIEVTQIPTILKSDPVDISEGVATLQERLGGWQA